MTRKDGSAGRYLLASDIQNSFFVLDYRLVMIRSDPMRDAFIGCMVGLAWSPAYGFQTVFYSCQVRGEVRDAEDDPGRIRLLFAPINMTVGKGIQAADVVKKMAAKLDELKAPDQFADTTSNVKRLVEDVRRCGIDKKALGKVQDAHGWLKEYGLVIKT